MGRTKKRVISLFVTLCMVLSMAIPAGVWADTKSDDIVILYTNDVHTYIDGELSYDVLAGMKRELEKQYNRVLLVDAGDHIQGTAYGSMDKGKTIIDLMNAAGYDLATLGNHEFDYGMDGRISVTDEWAKFPYISSNFYREAGGVIGDTVFDASKTFEDLGKWDVKFVGITTPESFTKSTPSYFQDANGNYIYGIAAGDDGQALYDAVQTAIGTPEADDIVIALGHLGDDPASQPWTSEETIANVSGLDAFIDGHSHSTVEGKVVKDKAGADVLLTQTGEYFDNVGMMVIDGETGAITTKLIPAADVAAAYPADASVKAIKDAWMTELEAQLGTVIGKAEVIFDNYDADGNRLVRKQGTNTGAFAADALYYLFDNMDMDVDVAVMNGGGVRNKAITGDITYKTCKEIHTFGNVACLQTVTGQQLLDALEWGAKDYPNECGGFLHPSGLTYDIDTSIASTVQADDKGVWIGGPTGEYRVKNVEILNRETGEYEPIDLEAKYNLAGYNYTLRDLGDGFAMFDGAVNVLDYVMEDYLVLANYVQSFDGGVITAENSPYGAVTDGERIDIYCGHVYDKTGVCAACQDTPELTEAQKAGWSAYYDFKAAYTAGNLEALKAAVEAFEAANEELEMEEQEFYGEMDDEFWTVLFGGNVVMTANGYYSDYTADKNAKTAYDFVSYYSQEDMEEYKADILRFMPDIEAVYEEAKANMPSENVVAVYEAYVGVQNALAFWIIDETTYAAVEGFEAVLDAFNEMGIYGDAETAEKDRADLAALMGVEDGETAWYQIFGDWVNLNVLLEVDEIYQAYQKNPNAETATALIEKYDGIYNDPNYVDEELRTLVENFFFDIHDAYAGAKALLAEDDVDEDVEAEGNVDAGENDVATEQSPDTGDNSNILLWIAMLFAAVMTMSGIQLVRRK